MDKYKEPSLGKTILITVIVVTFLFFGTFYSLVPNDLKDVAMLSLGCIPLGAIIGLFIYACIKPNKEKVRQIRLMEEQTEFIKNSVNNNSRASKSNITDELNKLVTMKNNGHITEEEFIKFKEKIINNK